MKADGRERALCLREGTVRKLQAQAGLGESGQSLEQSQWVWGRGGWSLFFTGLWLFSYSPLLQLS